MIVTARNGIAYRSVCVTVCVCVQHRLCIKEES